MNKEIEAMDKAHALDMLNTIGQNWDMGNCADNRAGWIVQGRQALDVLQADHDSHKETKALPLSYVMTIHFHAIPKMGYSSISPQRYFDELAERHNVTISVTGTNGAMIHYLDRKNADAVMDELYKENAGPRINCDD